MEISTFEKQELDRQADQIERVLSGFSIPARIEGGRISSTGVSYQLAPLAEPIASQIEGSSNSLAEAIGVPDVRILREAEGISIDIPRVHDASLRLLPLLEVVGELPPMNVLLGLAADGRPFVQAFSQPSSWHFMVTGPQGYGKSEVLRTTLICLCMGHSPNELQVAGIDLSGRELGVLEAMPHAVTDLASDQGSAQDLLISIAQEVDQRIRFKIRKPEFVLFVDELDNLMNVNSVQINSTIELILKHGASTGVHLFAGARSDIDQEGLNLFPRQKTVWATVETSGVGDKVPGLFQVFTKSIHKKKQVEVAWLPASDLDTGVREIQFRWGDGYFGFA